MAANNSCEGITNLYFANGMQNTFEDATTSLETLKSTLPEISNFKKENSFVSHCADEFIGTQLIKAYHQKMGESICSGRYEDFLLPQSLRDPLQLFLIRR